MFFTYCFMSLLLIGVLKEILMYYKIFQIGSSDIIYLHLVVMFNSLYKRVFSFFIRSLFAAYYRKVVIYVFPTEKTCSIFNSIHNDIDRLKYLDWTNRHLIVSF